MANPNIYALTDTRWSNAGTTYRAIWMDLNNGAAGSAVGAAASRPLLITNNGAGNLVFGCDLTGNLYSGGTTITFAGNAVVFPAAGTIGTLAFLSSINNTNWSGAQLTVPNGGTGQTTLTNHGLLVGAGASAITQLAAAAAGTVLTGQGTSADPSFSATPTLGVQQTTQGTLTLANTAAGAFATTVQSSNSASAAWTLTLPVTAGSNNQVLTTNGSGVTSWTSISSIGVSSVSNSDGTLTISPTTGAVVASLNLGNANTWTAVQTFTNSDIRLLGSSTGYTTFTSDNAGASNFTLHFPALNDTIMVLGGGQTITSATWNGTAITVAFGGTGRTTLTNHGVLVGAGTAAITQIAVPASGTLFQGVAASDPIWTATPTLGVQQTTQGTLTLANTAAGAFATTVQSSNSASAAWTLTLPTTAGSSGQLLSTDGAGVTSWITASGTGTVTSVSWTGGIVSIANPTTTPAFTIAGTSGGIVYFSGAATWASSAVLAVHGIVLGGGAGAAPYTVAVPASGTILQGVASADPSWTATPTLGVQQTTQGKLILANTAAGAFSTTIQSSNSASAAWTLTLPTSAGSNTNVLSTDGTGVTSWVSAGSGTVTSVSFTGGLISVATATTTPALTVAGTSGGVVYFSGASTWASSAALAVHGIVLGGGAGAAPYTVAVPASGTILQGVASADPSWTATPTLGVQQTTQGQLILANTAAGAFSTTVQSSNSATAAWTLTLPTTAGTNLYLLQTNGSGVTSWVSPTSVGAVTSVSNSDGTLTISPTTGAVVASLNLGQANTWTAIQTFTNSDIRLLGSSTGYTTFTSANAGASNFTLTFPAVTDTLAGKALANGGTNASLTASNGGIIYSTASAFAILSGTATANQVLLSGSNTTPAWSTATYPATTTINQILYSSSANVIAGLATANGGILNANSSGVPSVTITPTLGVQQTSQGTLTLANTAAGAFATTVQSSNSATAAWTLTLPTTAGSNNQVLTTNGSGVSSWTTPTTGTVTSIATAGLATGGTITTTGTITVTASSTAQALAGTDTSTAMTPQSTWTAMSFWTERFFGAT